MNLGQLSLSCRRKIRSWRWRHLRRGKSGVARLNLGCGNSALEDYINIDVVPSQATDFVADISDLAFLESAFWEEIRLDAVFEHLWRWQQLPFLQHVWRALQPGGLLVINWLPDFEVITRAWQQEQPGLKGPVFDLYHVYRFTHGDPQPNNGVHQVHKDLFTEESLAELLRTAGFSRFRIQHVCYRDEYLPLNMKVEAWK